MMEIPLDGPANVFCDNEAVYTKEEARGDLLSPRERLERNGTAPRSTTTWTCCSISSSLAYREATNTHFL
jgi:hypothetical protein